MVQEHNIPDNSVPHTVAESQNGDVLESGDKNLITDETPPWTVEQALRSFNHPILSTPPKTPIAFFHLINRLKLTPREGWRRFGICDTPPPNSRRQPTFRGESVSDHMYRMSIITMLAPSSLTQRLDIPRCTRMALIHDMAEALVGDITPVDPVPKAEKSRREMATIEYIAEELLGACGEGGREAGREMREVWTEYEEGRTGESLFVHDVDKLELLLQMVEYERDERYEWIVEKGDDGRESRLRLDLGEFSRVAGRVVLPEMRAWAAEVLRERVELWVERGESAKFLEANRDFIAEVEAERQK